MGAYGRTPTDLLTPATPGRGRGDEGRAGRHAEMTSEEAEMRAATKWRGGPRRVPPSGSGRELARGPRGPPRSRGARGTWPTPRPPTRRSAGGRVDHCIAPRTTIRRPCRPPAPRVRPTQAQMREPPGRRPTGMERRSASRRDGILICCWGTYGGYPYKFLRFARVL